VTEGATGFEIGPLPTVGAMIAADGSVGGAGSTQTVSSGSRSVTAQTAWSGHFAAGGVLSGTFTQVAPDPVACAAGIVHPTFTAKISA
jgi:hypothetical protein